jgi:DNA-binding response OmpR family regulator
VTRILVVEDDPDIRSMLSARLRSAGLCVTAVPNAFAALTAVRDERPDVVVLDVRLPGRSGLDFCRDLRADPVLAGVGVVVASASVGEANVAAAYAAGADDFVAKPFSLAGLVARVRTVAGGTARREQQRPALA